jgi:hypothetical protein
MEFISTKNSTHGMSGHPAYSVYRSMIDRCRLPTHQAWRNYGGRGIQVCESWQRGFQYFWGDMADTYAPGLDLDRKDNDGPYSPENCHWVSRRQNSMNRRITIRVVDVPQLSRLSGIGKTTLYNRLKAGWPVDQLLRKPDFTNRCTT